VGIDDFNVSTLKEEQEIGKLQKLVGKYSNMIQNIQNDEQEALKQLSIL